MNSWLKLSELTPATDGGQVMDGNVNKAVFCDAAGTRYFTKRYHPVLQTRDAIYESLGQSVALASGIEAAVAYLVEESPLYLCSRDILAPHERILTLRALKIEARKPRQVVAFYRENLQDTSYPIDIMLLDAVLNNRGRHTGNLGVIVNAAGGILRSCPVFDTVAFDNTRLAEAAKNNKPRWIERGTSSGQTHKELGAFIHQETPDFPFTERLTQIGTATLEVLSQFWKEGLISTTEYDLMLKVVEESMADLLEGYVSQGHTSLQEMAHLTHQS